jgi:DNA polymerase III epsilon subunit-like protein
MHKLFFDTETTGLPKSRNARNHDVDNWPRLVQLSWLLKGHDGPREADLSTDKMVVRNRLVIPWGFQIPPEAMNIHGITNTMASEDGISIQEALYEFLVAVEMADLLIGHGVYFDKSVVGAELIRLGMESAYEIFKGVNRFDTMAKSTKICKLPKPGGGKGYKWPKLQELHKHLFGVEFEDAHDAYADVQATVKCYEALIEQGVE